MAYEIQKNKLNEPYLKWVDRPRKPSEEGRGLWVDVGRVTDKGIEQILRRNEDEGYIFLVDENDTYRVLVLTD
jgi:hypothetical protein